MNLRRYIAAIGGGAQLIFGGNLNAYAVVIGLLSVCLQVNLRRYVRYLKWLTLALFAYVGTVFVIHVPWGAVLRATAIPSILVDHRLLDGSRRHAGNDDEPIYFSAGS